LFCLAGAALGCLVAVAVKRSRAIHAVKEVASPVVFVGPKPAAGPQANPAYANSKSAPSPPSTR
jgi:hypothetical protein